VRPYKRPVFHPAHGCVAITVRGQRCNRDHYTEIPITFSWDPIRGVGIEAPSAPFCRMHDYLWSLEPGERVEIVGGWMGRAWNPNAKCWTVLTTVYESRRDLGASPHWWALRRPAKFGACDRFVYSEATREPKIPTPKSSPDAQKRDRFDGLAALAQAEHFAALAGYNMMQRR
jgi:hypothetical protein